MTVITLSLPIKFVNFDIMDIIIAINVIINGIKIVIIDNTD